MKSAKPNTRRNFLLAAGLGTAGAAAAVATATRGVKGAKEAASPDTSSGYRDSEHIRKYYETTKV
ncbi:hypothetical protein DSM104443_02673 [Usitatibacter rugosus]|uniref:Secreted protein n=1 Tax=Usitatibacter rugosus TaxID=2732067 RepID=A0A6M4GYL5_9PROT|nr:hypothetical protein [Usitatibacter rugosus]QJR11594.1 hypothetical protein DSM104443_02673 [Usitatibacter rugosus]